MKKTALTALAAVFLLSSCGSKTKHEANVLTVASLYEPNSLNTTLNSEAVNAQAIDNVIEGLLTYDEKGQLIGSMADTWEVSPDGLTYKFHIRDGVTWSNGEPVTAHDFEFAWKELASKDAPYRTLLIDIKNGEKVLNDEMEVDALGIEAMDDENFVVTLESPKIYFEKLMAFSSFFPINEAFYESVGGSTGYGLSADTILSNGPFIMESFDPSLEYTMVKNPNYWNAENVTLEKVVTRIIKEPTTQTSLYEKGEIDRLQLSADQVDQFADSDEKVEFLEGRTGYIYLSGNTKKEDKVLENDNFRKAVAYAIDKTVITEKVMKNGSLPSDYLIPKEFDTLNGKDFRDYSGAYNELRFDTDKAQEYLDKAKKELGQDTFTIDLAFRETEGDKQINESLKSQIETNLPGVTVNLEMRPQAQYFPALYNYDTPAANAGWGADYIDVASFFSIFRSFDDHNFAQYNNPAYDKLVEEAEQQATAEARWDKFAEAEKILVEDNVIIPIYQRGTTVLVKPYVKGYKVNTVSPEVYYKYITVEE